MSGSNRRSSLFPYPPPAGPPFFCSAAKERGERKRATPPHAAHARVPSPAQTPRGCPPAKTFRRMHSDPSAYRSSWRDQDRGACARRGGCFSWHSVARWQTALACATALPRKTAYRTHRDSVSYGFRGLPRSTVLVPDAGAPGPPPPSATVPDSWAQSDP